MNITRIDHYNDGNDFVIEGKHARMTQYKVAKFLLINKSSVSRYIERVAQHDPELSETLKNKGFDMIPLIDIVYYFATSNQVTKKVKNNCIKILYDLTSKTRSQELFNETVKNYCNSFFNRPKENLVDVLIKDGSFIYLIQNMNTGNLKIGYSVNPCQRFIQLQQSTDCELKLLAFFEGTVIEEQTLLLKYAKYQIRGEWFTSAPEIYLDFGLTYEFVDKSSK